MEGVRMDAITSKKFALSTTAALTIVMVSLMFAAWRAEAVATPTAATGGTGISVDTAATATTPAWTTLTGPIVITEGATTDIAAEGSVTLTFTAPAGFEYNQAISVNVGATGADITAIDAAVTYASATQMQFAYTAGAVVTSDVITIGDTVAIQVRPTGGTPASGNITVGTTGTLIVGITGATNFGSLSSVAGTMTQLGVTTEPATATAGAVFGQQPAVKTQDQFGNNTVVGLGANLTVTAALTTGSGTLQGTLGLDIGTGVGNGTVTYTDLRNDVAEAGKVITFSATGPTSAVTAGFTVSPAAASKLAMTGQPSASTVAGVAFATQPIVTVQDAFNNTVTGDTSTVTLSLTTGTGTLGGTVSMAAVAGIADFTGKGMNIDLVGADKVLTATDGGLTLATTNAFTITVAAASKLAITGQPSASTVAGVAFATQPIVTVQDAFGNTASGDTSTVTLALTTGTGALSGTASMAAVAGVADFSGKGLNIDLVGADKVLTATDGGLTLATTNAFTITVAAASKLAVTTQPTASTVAGVAIATQPIVTVQDAFGNTITTDSATVVTLALTTGSGTLSGTVTKTAASGIADFTGQALSIQFVGADKVLTATGGGYTAATTNAFTITNAAASKLAFTTQPSASSTVSVAFTTQPVVTVQDAFGNTVTGDTSTVTLALTTGTGTLSGTLTKAAVAGVADFAGQGLKIDLEGADKVLTATDGGLTLATTSAFAIVAAMADPEPDPEPVPTVTDDGVTVTVENTETTATSTTVEVELTTTSSDGSEAAITVPAGALPEGTTLEVSAISNLASLVTQARPPATVDVTLAFSITATASDGSAVKSGFSEPVSLNFTVDASVVPAGATDDQLRLAFWNGLRWVLIDATVTVNADGTVTVSGTTDHFTLFAVMYNPVGFGVAFEGELPTTGVGFVTFGGTTTQLEAALVNQSCISPIFVTNNGEWVGFIPTVQIAAVNAAFNALFADGIPLGTPMVATGCND
jgi:hypothetical protein